MTSKHGCLFIPHRDGCVLIAGTRNDISPQQSDILSLFYEHKGQVVTRDMIGIRLWGEPEQWPATWQKQIDVHVTTIRASLPRGYIATEYGTHWSARWHKLTAMRGSFKGWRLVGDLHIELFVKEE